MVILVILLMYAMEKENLARVFIGNGYDNEISPPAPPKNLKNEKIFDIIYTESLRKTKFKKK